MKMPTKCPIFLKLRPFVYITTSFLCRKLKLRRPLIGPKGPRVSVIGHLKRKKPNPISPYCWFYVPGTGGRKISFFLINDCPEVAARIPGNLRHPRPPGPSVAGGDWCDPSFLSLWPRGNSGLVLHGFMESLKNRESGRVFISIWHNIYSVASKGKWLESGTYSSGVEKYFWNVLEIPAIQKKKKLIERIYERSLWN